MVGVVLPVLNGYLKAAGWRYDSIGAATALPGLGTLLFQTPAGILTDRFSRRRALFAASALFTGVCFTLIPLARDRILPIDALLFTSGVIWMSAAPPGSAMVTRACGRFPGPHRLRTERSCSFSSLYWLSI